MISWKCEWESAGFEISFPERLLEKPTGDRWDHWETANVCVWNVHGRFQVCGGLMFGEPDEILNVLKRSCSGKAIPGGFDSVDGWLGISSLGTDGRLVRLQFCARENHNRSRARLTIPVDSGLLRQLTTQWREAMKKT